MKFPNSEFYNGNLKSDSSVNDINLDEIIDALVTADQAAKLAGQND